MAVGIQITGPDGTVRHTLIEGPIEVGRDVSGPTSLQLDDASVSRLHARFEPGPDGGLVVTDLGSSFGSFINGQRLVGPALLQHGATLAVGNTTITLVAQPVSPPPPSEPVQAPPPPAAPMPAPPLQSAPQAVGPALTTISGDGIEVCFVAGSAGERFARGMLSAARKARRRLAGFGNEGMGGWVRFHLLDPFPDPANPARLVTQGCVIDPDSAQVWMAVSPEAPPDEPERALATIFAASLPAADALGWLVEGYALQLAEVGDVDAMLRGTPLPPWPEAADPLRPAMAASFVGFLLSQQDAPTLRRLLVEAQPDSIDATFERLYGATLGQLDGAWRAGLAHTQAPEKGSLGQFLKLSWRYLRPHRARQAEIFVWMAAGLAFTVVMPFATRQLFDVVLPSGEMSRVLGLLGLLLGAFVLSLLAGLRRSYVSGYVSGALVRDLRNEMFDRLQFLPTQWYRATPQGDVLSRLFSDVALVEDGLSSTLREGVFQLLSMVVTAVVLLRLDPQLAVIVLVGTPAVVLVYRAMGSGARSRSLAVQEQTGALMNVAAENHMAEQVVKVYGLQGRELGRFQAAGEQLFRSERRLALFSGVFGLLVNSVVTLLRIGVLAVGSWMVIRGRLTVGTLVAFLGLMGELVGPVTTLTTIGQNLQSASGALARIDEILATPGSAGDVGGVAAPLRRDVRFVSVGFGYGAGPRVLDEVDFTVAKGERVAIVGPSGSGKSTVVRLLMRLHDPDEGSILYDGTEVRQLSAASVRARLGVVFQDSFLFDGTVADNIALGNPGAEPGAIAAAATAAELDDVLATLPGGFGAQVGPGGANLSGGQRQRVAIARALVRNPDILLLDEATSALDPQTERQLGKTLDDVSRHRTTIAITHRLGSIAGYDRILVIDRGRIVETGAHDSLLAAGGLYARLWAEQTGGVAGTPTADVVEALAKLPFLASLAAEVLAQVAEHLQPVTLGAGQRLAERTDAVAIISRGRAAVVASGPGGPAHVVELGPGDAFGVSALLGDPAGVELVATSDVALWDLPRSMVDSLAGHFPAVAAALRAGSAPEAPAAAPASRRMPRLTLAGAVPPGVTGGR